jgi:hypothetical protein
MIETIASSYFEFFPGDFLVAAIAGSIFWLKKSKEDEDFYG